MKKMNRILFGLVALLATQPAMASLTTAAQRLYGTLPSFGAAKTTSPAFYPKPTGTTFGTPGMPSQTSRPTTPILTPFMMQQRHFGQFPGQQFRPAAPQQQSFWNRYNPANWFKASTSPYFSQQAGYASKQYKDEWDYLGVKKGANNWEILGIEPGATQEQIKKAFILRAKNIHPDVAPEEYKYIATKAFQILESAYSDLLAGKSQSENTYESGQSAAYKAYRAYAEQQRKAYEDARKRKAYAEAKAQKVSEELIRAAKKIFEAQANMSDFGKEMIKMIKSVLNTNYSPLTGKAMDEWIYVNDQEVMITFYIDKAGFRDFDNSESKSYIRASSFENENIFREDIKSLRNKELKDICYMALGLIEFNKKATPDMQKFIHEIMGKTAAKYNLNNKNKIKYAWKNDHVVIRIYSAKYNTNYDTPLETFTNKSKAFLWFAKIVTMGYWRLIAAILGSWVLYNLIFGDDVEKAKEFELDYLNKMDESSNEFATMGPLEKQKFHDNAFINLNEKFAGNMNAPSKQEIINNIERAQNTKELYDIHQQIEHYLLVKAINASKPGWGTSVYEWFTRK